MRCQLSPSVNTHYTALISNTVALASTPVALCCKRGVYRTNPHTYANVSCNQASHWYCSAVDHGINTSSHASREAAPCRKCPLSIQPPTSSTTTPQAMPAAPCHTQSPYQPCLHRKRLLCSNACTVTLHRPCFFLAFYAFYMYALDT